MYPTIHLTSTVHSTAHSTHSTHSTHSAHTAHPHRPPTLPLQVLKVAGMLLSADRTGTVIMWDVTTGSATLSITTGHTDILMALWVEDSYLFTASLDGRVKVWNAEGEMLHEQGVTNQHNGTVKVPPCRCLSSASAPPQGAPGGSRQLGTPRMRGPSQ